MSARRDVVVPLQAARKVAQPQEGRDAEMGMEKGLRSTSPRSSTMVSGGHGTACSTKFLLIFGSKEWSLQLLPYHNDILCQIRCHSIASRIGSKSGSGGRSGTANASPSARTL